MWDIEEKASMLRSLIWFNPPILPRRALRIRIGVSVK